MFPNQIISACQANLTLLTKCNDPTKLPWLKLGLLGEDLIAAHAIHLNDEEMDTDEGQKFPDPGPGRDY